MFRKLSFALGSMLTTSAASAGTLTEPTVEVVENAEAAASSSSSGIIIPLLILIAVVALASKSDSGSVGSGV